jgi:hypothetical protein
MKDRTTRPQKNLGVTRNEWRWMLGLVLGVEAVLFLLGGAILLIGNDLIFAIVPLLAFLLRWRSARQLFERLSFRVVVSHVALVSFQVGAGIWLLSEVGFTGQNFICWALH